MRKINYIVLHCTATSQLATVENIQKYWKEVLKWKSPGYHFLIAPNGDVHRLAPLENICNGVAGYNKESIHISYIGGIDDHNKPKDNRTEAQLKAMEKLVKDLLWKYPAAKVLGHRDFKGVSKACPSFDVAIWLKGLNLKDHAV